MPSLLPAQPRLWMIRASAALLVGAALALGLAPSSGVVAWGAESEGQKPPQKTRRVPSMSEATFKKLAEAQEFVDAKDLAGAEKVLQGMLDRSRRYNGNEIGQIHNMLGFVFFSKEDYNQAIHHYRIVIEQGDDIPEGLETTTLYTLAQLSFVAERYQDALRYMETWISKAQNPGPERRCSRPATSCCRPYRRQTELLWSTALRPRLNSPPERLPPTSSSSRGWPAPQATRLRDRCNRCARVRQRLPPCPSRPRWKGGAIRVWRSCSSPA